MPISGDCVVTVGGIMLDGRISSHALIVRLPEGEKLKFGDNSGPYVDANRQGIYSFASGTVIESGVLVVSAPQAPNTLASNVDIGSLGGLEVQGQVIGNIANRGSLSVWGALRGNLDNAGTTVLSNDVYGHVLNSGTLSVSAAVYGNAPRIHGNLEQTSAGTLSFALAPFGWDSPAPLLVDGVARLDGTLQLQLHTDAWGPHYLPATTAHHILQANGGLSGQFARWTSPGLFVEGSLRYGSNAVWFDLKRISVQAAMTTAGAAPFTLASAGNLDRALAGGDAFASVATATLNPAQSRFLQSAGYLLWMDDARQATRSLDSLSGSEHADALRRAGQGDAMASALGQRLLSLQSGEVSGRWSQSGVHGMVAGFDQWIGARLLLGASTSIDNNTEAGSQARDHARQAALYLRWFGDDGWYAGGNAGFARHALTVDRPIDLGRGGRWNAHSQRGVGVAAFAAEVGRRFKVGGGVFAPYAGLGVDVLRSERALEQGATGFELALQANTQARLTAGIGLRYGKRWNTGEGSWLQLDADARVQQGLAEAGAPLQAAFIGVPDVGFALTGKQAATSGWLDVGLRGGFAPDWRWSLGHTGPFAASRPERRWLFEVQHSF